MASPTEEFISSFHSLTGITVGDRRKNLFLLLNKIQAPARDEIDFSCVHPKTPLEETFKVDALIHFRRVPELLDVLKSENPVLVRKVLKIRPWFFEQALQSVSGDELVTLIFPHVSFNVKVKIVNKLAVHLKDAKKADGFFEAIRQKYGSYLARKLLPSCSKNFILQTVVKSKTNLSSTQLLIILKRYPELSKEILGVLSSHMDEYSIRSTYKNVFVYLARAHNELFLDLWDKYNPYVRLGWRATHRFICKNKEVVIKDANNLHKLLHKRQCSKSLKQDFREFYANLFPPSVEQFPKAFELLCHVTENFPDEEKLNLLEATFRKTYCSELLDHPECLSVAILDLLPVSRRESFGYKPPLISEDLRNCYKRTDHSIPYLKNRISLSSDVKAREDLVRNLVETCRINKDRKALAEVCRYVVNQHRNDHANVRQAFLTALERSFKLETLEEEHWTNINELIQIFEMNRESFRMPGGFLVAFIHHRLLKKQDIKEQLSEYIKLVRGKWNLFKNNPVFEKHCLLLTGELLPSIFEKQSLKYNNVIFLNSLVDWNKRHPEDEISLFGYPAAMHALGKVLADLGDASTAQLIIHYILKLESADSDLLRLCLSKLSLYFANRDIVNGLMHRKPLFVLDNVDTISKLVFYTPNRFFWRQCRNYTHLEIPQKLGTACLEALAVDVLPAYRGDLIKRNAIVGLSYLMNADKFLEFASDYHPTELRADALSDESKKRYKLQRAVASSLKNVIPPSLTLQSILNFGKGDYLKLIQSSLYSVSGNVNEDKLPLFFGQLGNRAVSVRKHTFHLTLRVLERSRVFSVINKFMEIEKNPSIRKFLLRGSFNLFVQDPDDSLWELVKSNTSAVNADDREVVQFLTEMDKIPVAYMARYVVFMWELLGRLPDPDGVNEIAKYGMLRSLSADAIRMLRNSFCSEIIETCFLEFEYPKHVTCNIDSFACRFIIYGASEREQEPLIRAILSVLKNYLSKDKWSNVVDRFLRQFCSEFLDRKCLSREIFSTFATLWNGYIQPSEAFDHHLYLQFCLIYIDSVNGSLTPSEVGENLAKLIDSLLGVHGTAVVSVISDVLTSFVRHFLEGTGVVNEMSRYRLIEGMIKGNVSQACLIAAISLLKRNVEYSEPQKKHTFLVQFLNQLFDPLIQIHLNHHLYRM